MTVCVNQSTTFTWSLVLLRKSVFTLPFSSAIVSCYPFEFKVKNNLQLPEVVNLYFLMILLVIYGKI